MKIFNLLMAVVLVSSCATTEKVVKTVVTSVQDCAKREIAENVPSFLKIVTDILADAASTNWGALLDDLAALAPNGLAIVTCTVQAVFDANMQALPAGDTEHKLRSTGPSTAQSVMMAKRAHVYLTKVGLKTSL